MTAASQRRKRVAAGAKSALVWGVVFFAGAQIGLNSFVEWRRPDFYDPEYRARLMALKARIAEAPDRPLLLLTGSSRTALSFRPEMLPPLQAPSGRQPLVFNFSHLGAGPAANLMELRRLLDQGIRPDWLVLELMPPFLTIERLGSTADVATAADLPLLRRYFSPWKLGGNYVKSRLIPWYNYRVTLLHDVAPDLLPPQTRLAGDFPIDPLGSWWIRKDALAVVAADQIPRQMAYAQAAYAKFLHEFRILPGPARAVRDLLELCAREHIPAAVLLSPESKAYQAWYSSRGLAELERLCADLRLRYNVPVIDARDWLADADFCDGHHVLLRGANAFTKRLGTEVLQPLVAGRLCQGYSPAEGQFTAARLRPHN